MWRWVRVRVRGRELARERRILLCTRRATGADASERLPYRRCRAAGLISRWGEVDAAVFERETVWRRWGECRSLAG